MRLLLFSDLHADAGAARRLVRLSGAADGLVGAGDFGNAHADVGRCVGILSACNKPAVVVPGNNETPDELVAACGAWPTAVVLHGSATTVAGVAIFGLGGGVPVTPFGDWSFDLTEEAAAELLKGCPPGCVLVTHSPPHGAADRNSRGIRLGSTAIRAAVERTRPRLVVCGHIHGSAGVVADVAGVPVVNAGPAGLLWDLEAGEPVRTAAG